MHCFVSEWSRMGGFILPDLTNGYVGFLSSAEKRLHQMENELLWVRRMDG